MKKVILSLMGLFLAATFAVAQKSDMRPMRWQGFETNRFWDNWEISAGGGNSFLQISQKWGSDPGRFIDRNSWNANLGVTKWIVPVVGLRMQFEAGEFRNYSYDMARYGKGVFKMPYLMAHGDILVNMSNWIGGYKPNRLYSAISYMGFGYTAMSWTKKSQGGYNGELTFTSGLLSKFRVAPQWDIELDLRTWILAERSLSPKIQGGGRYAVAMSASVGFAYRFKQRDWLPAYSQVDVDGYILAAMALEEQVLVREAEVAKLGATLSTLESRNSALQSQLAACSAKQKSTPVIFSESVVFFEIGEATLSDYAKAVLDSFIAQFKGQDLPIVVTGYADKETGSAKRNEQLSMSRAESVVDYLVAGGVSVSNITTQWVGDTEQAFSTPASPVVNRCVVIQIPN